MACPRSKVVSLEAILAVEHGGDETPRRPNRRWLWAELGLEEDGLELWSVQRLRLEAHLPDVKRLGRPHQYVETCRDCGLDHQTSNVSFDKGAQQHRVAWSNTEQLCLFKSRRQVLFQQRYALAWPGDKRKFLAAMGYGRSLKVALRADWPVMARVPLHLKACEVCIHYLAPTL